MFFFFNDTATTEIYTLSLHDALPISRTTASTATSSTPLSSWLASTRSTSTSLGHCGATDGSARSAVVRRPDRKSTRLNSSHANISYAVFCLKKKIHQHPGILGE